MAGSAFCLSCPEESTKEKPDSGSQHFEPASDESVNWCASSRAEESSRADSLITKANVYVLVSGGTTGLPSLPFISS